MKSPYIRSFFKSFFLWLYSFSLSFFLVVSTPLFYFFSIKIFEIEKATGLTQTALLKNYQHLLNYLLFPWVKELRFFDFASSYQGLKHFAEVKVLFQAHGVFFFLMSLLLSVIFLYKNFSRYQSKEELQTESLDFCPKTEKLYQRLLSRKGKIEKIFPFFFFVLSLVLGSLPFFAPQQAFVWMHERLFQNRDWLFDPSKDSVILALPFSFFAFLFVVIFLFALIFQLVFFVLAFSKQKAFFGKNNFLNLLAFHRGKKEEKALQSSLFSKVSFFLPLATGIFCLVTLFFFLAHFSLPRQEVEQYTLLQNSESQEIEQSLWLQASILEEQKRKEEEALLQKQREEAKEKYKKDFYARFLEKIESLGIAKEAVSFVFTKNNEKVASHQESKIFVAASTVKIAFAMGLMDRIERGERKLTDVVALIEDDYEGGDGSITADFKVGNQYTLQELLKETLVTSDNTAFHALNRQMYAQNAYGQSYLPFAMEDYLEGNKIQADIGMALVERLHSVKHYALIREYLAQATLTYGLLENLKEGEKAYGKQGILTGGLHALLAAFGQEGTEGKKAELLEETSVLSKEKAEASVLLLPAEQKEGLTSVDAKLSLYLLGHTKEKMQALVLFFLEENRRLDAETAFSFYGKSYTERVLAGEISLPEIYKP